MARVPKHDVPSLTQFFLLLCVVGLTLVGVFVGILATGDMFRSVGHLLNEMLRVLV